MKRKILYITHEVIPGLGLAVGGGGLRTWGLMKGLEAHGHQVIYSLHEDVLKRLPNPSEEIRQNAHRQENLNNFIQMIQPDVVLFQQWPSACTLDAIDIPVVMDLHGSLLIENSYRQLGDFRTNVLTKLRTLENVDYFVCAGDRQKYYWWAWLMLAGVDPKDIRIDTVPVSLSSDLPQFKKNPEQPRFVFGGVAWPWQDPSLALNTVAETLDKYKKGQLDLYIGKHPTVQITGEKYNDLQDSVRAGERVIFHDMIPHDELIQLYTQSAVAVDIMRKNTERELAFTTRTIEYLWCGLPVIYGDYLELAQPIREYKAGWVVNPNDKDGIRKVTEQILEHPEIVEEYGKNAQQLVRDKFTWEKAITPLSDFMEEPTRREHNPSFLKQASEHIRHLEAEMGAYKWLQGEHQRVRAEFEQAIRDRDAAQADLKAIRSKFMFRAFKSAKRLLRLE